MNAKTIYLILSKVSSRLHRMTRLNLLLTKMVKRSQSRRKQRMKSPQLPLESLVPQRRNHALMI